MAVFEGWLLDVDSVTEEGRAVIRLWCKDAEGRTAVLFDRSFEPYFYLLPRGADPALVERVQASRGSEAVSPRRVEPVKKRVLGRPVEGLRVTARHPGHVPALREALARHGEVMEADIPFGVRYTVDRGLAPMEGLRAEGAKADPGYGDLALDLSAVRPAPRAGLPPLKTLAFDTEMAVAAGMPNPSRDPVIILSHASSEGRTELLTLDREDDRALLEGFVAAVREEDPDFIVGYNSDGFDWPFLRDRAAGHKVPLALGRDGSEVRFRPGALPVVEAAGRQVVDLFRIAQRDMGEVKVKTLVNVADYLGVLAKGKRVDLEPWEIYEAWHDPKKRPTLMDYARADVVSTLGLAERLLPMQYEFARMTRHAPEDVAKMGRGRQVEAYLTAEAHPRDELVPAKPAEAGESYEGGYVLEPVKGIHENVVSLDFSAMYPSIMVAYNISPDTVAPPGFAGEVHTAPEVGHRFRKSPDGFFKALLADLVARRRAVQKQKAALSRGSPEATVLDVRQKALKVLSNSFYGYTGWRAARWYRKECAEATAAWGRHIVRLAMERAREAGFEVIYGDTDSLFLKARGTPKELEARALTLAEKVSAQFPLELDLDKFYTAIFFTEKKKRYAGLTADGEVVVRGLEVRRGDWCALAKELQQEVIHTVLRERDVAGAAARAAETVRALREGRVPLEKMVIHKTVTRRLGDYESRQAHVRAAERAEAADLDVEVGSKLAFVIAQGTESISERAYPVELFLKEKRALDAEYYIRHQLVPAALRVLGYFGVTEEELLGQKHKQQNLSAFM
jgi:DNA polymerase I